LNEDQSLLKKNIIKFDSNLNIEKRQNLAYELKNVAKQRPNSKFLGVFPTRTWIYYSTEKRDSLKRFGRWVRKRIAEPPQIYNPQLTEETAETMQDYLNNKGFFDAQIAFNQVQTGKTTEVTYTVTPNTMLTIDTAINEIEFNKINAILTVNKHKSLFKKGKPVENTLFEQEKSRISRLLRNQGYAYFYPNYVKFLCRDSSNHKAKVITTILPPEKGEHETYSIGNIYIYPGFYPSIQQNMSTDTIDLGDGYFFISSNGEFPNIKSKPILNSIHLRKGNQYNQDAYDATNKKLGALGIYKFVSIRFYKNKEQPNVLDFNIMLTPIKKQEVGYALDIYTDNGNGLGIGSGLNYRNRNLFKGAEVFLFNVEGGLEIQQSDDETDVGFDKVFNSFDFNANTTLYFPKFILPFKLKPGLRNYSPKTRIVIDVDYTQRRNYFTNTVFSTAFGYEWRANKHVRHILNPFSVNLLLIDSLDSDFQDILDRNDFLRRSFVNQVFLGGDYTFIYTSPVFKGSSWVFRFSLDVAGNAFNLVDRVVNSTENFSPFGNEYSQYTRLDGDLRYYYNVGRRSTFATRLSVASGFAYGNSSTIPYVKQYFVGGTSSVRAWRIRELGPGAHVPPEDVTNNTFVPYQAANFKMEGSMEYRFDIFYTLEGALFIDAGNIWTLREDPDRPGSQLSKAFLRQFAVGFGYGFRFDFSYFVIRFDLAYKLRNPYIDPDTSNGYNAFEGFGFKNMNFNLAVGYPF